MSTITRFSLQLFTTAGLAVEATGNMSIRPDGSIGRFSVSKTEWPDKPLKKVASGTLSFCQGEIGFSGDFWRLLQGEGLTDRFIMLCGIDLNVGSRFAQAIEGSWYGQGFDITNPAELLEGYLEATLAGRVRLLAAQNKSLKRTVRDLLSIIDNVIVHRNAIRLPKLIAA